MATFRHTKTFYTGTGCRSKSKEKPQMSGVNLGSGNWTRTSDIRINSPLFYRLNYARIARISYNFFLCISSVFFICSQFGGIIMVGGAISGVCPDKVVDIWRAGV